jgi:hypothetical protein
VVVWETALVEQEAERIVGVVVVAVVVEVGTIVVVGRVGGVAVAVVVGVVVIVVGGAAVAEVTVVGDKVVGSTEVKSGGENVTVADGHC